MNYRKMQMTEQKYIKFSEVGITGSAGQNLQQF